MSTGTELSALLATNLHNDASFTAANKLTYLNLAVKRIMRDAPERFRKKEASLAITAAAREYSLATDFFMISSIWLQTTGHKLTPMLPGEFVDQVERIPTTPTGSPEEYIILGFDESQDTPAYRIRFDKTPDGNYTLTYWYYPMPAAITADATPALSTMGYDEMIVAAATMIALQPKDPEGSAIAKQAYLEILREFRAFNPMGPDYTPVQRPNSFEYGKPGPALPSNYPVD